MINRYGIQCKIDSDEWGEWVLYSAHCAVVDDLEQQIAELEATIRRVRDGATQYGENLVYEINRLLDNHAQSDRLINAPKQGEK